MRVGLREVAVRVTVTGDPSTSSDRRRPLEQLQHLDRSSIVTAAAGGRIAKHGNRAGEPVRAGAPTCSRRLGSRSISVPTASHAVVETHASDSCSLALSPRDAARRSGAPGDRHPYRVQRAWPGSPTRRRAQDPARRSLARARREDRRRPRRARDGSRARGPRRGRPGRDHPSLPTRTWRVRVVRWSKAGSMPEDLGVTPVGRSRSSRRSGEECGDGAERPGRREGRQRAPRS